MWTQTQISLGKFVIIGQLLFSLNMLMIYFFNSCSFLFLLQVFLISDMSDLGVMWNRT